MIHKRLIAALLSALLILTLTAVATAEDNDDMSSAPTLVLSFAVTGDISGASDADYYAFTVDQARNVTFGIDSADLAVLDATGSEIGSAGVLTLAAGQYYLRVSSAAPAHYTATAVAEIIDSLDLSEYNLATGMLCPDAPHAYTTRSGIRTGGNVYAAIACLARGDGMALERDSRYILPYDEEGTLDYFDGFAYTPAPQAYSLKQAVMLPQRRSATDNAAYKNAIVQYGALCAGIRESGEYYAQNQTYYYHPAGLADGTGHAVTVIGWDDSIPKERFTVTGPDGNAHTPAGDGAFIIKNSYGTGSGDGGVLYISYYSADFSSNPATVFFLEAPASEAVYQHDYLGYTNYDEHRNDFSGGEIYQKSVFAATGGGPVTAVSFWLTQAGAEYEIYINGASVARGTRQFTGYYKQSIEPVQIAAGETFTVTVRIKASSGNISAAVQSADVGISANTSPQPGQCFFATDGASWTDLSASRAVNCVKAFQNGAAPSNTVPNTLALGSTPAAYDLREHGGVTSVKNQCRLIPTCWAFAACASCESTLLLGTQAELPAPAPTATAPAVTPNPSTGDAAHIYIWLPLAVAALAGIALAIFRFKTR